jgi:hypothetical protein
MPDETKEIKSEAEIAAMINAAIKKYDVCRDVKVFVSRIPDDGYTNWEASTVRGSGNFVLPECRRAILAVVSELRQKYELVTDA